MFLYLKEDNVVREEMRGAAGIEPLKQDINVHVLLERKRIFDIVTKSLEKFPIGIFVMTGKGRPVYANETAKHILNYDSGDLPALIKPGRLPNFCQAFIAGTDQIYPASKSPMARALAGEVCTVEDIEIRGRSRVIPIEASAGPIYDQNGDLIYIMVFFRDIAERRRAEEIEKWRIRALTSLSKRTVEFINLSPEEDIYAFIAQQLKELVGDGVVVVNSFDKTSQLFCTRAVLGIGNKTNALRELLGGSLIGMATPINEEALFGLTSGKLENVRGGLYVLSGGAVPRRACKKVNELLNLGSAYAMGFSWSGKLYGSANILMHKGDEIQDPHIIEIFIKQASLTLQRRQAEEALRKTKEELEIRVKERTVELAKAVEELRREIVERKKRTDELHEAYANLEKTHHELIQTEKLAAIGRLSSGITHEMKNPLGIILGGVEFMEKKLSKPGREVQTVLDKVKSATLRANSIVQSILKYARPSELNTEKIELNSLVSETLHLFKEFAPSVQIEIETVSADEKLYVEVDKIQIQEVLLNLLENSRDATSKNGTVVIRTSKFKALDAFDGIFGLIEVVDSGEGISDENQKKLFEPFFSTKRAKKGTGLGLFVSKMIVENHRGKLEIESQWGKGTKAKVILPLIEGEADYEEKNPHH